MASSEKKDINVPLFAKVAFNIPLKKTFTYKIPLALRDSARKGMLVVAPFGNKSLTGYLVDIIETPEPGLRLKSLEDFPNTRPVLSSEVLSLTRWVADYYQGSWGEAIKAALPTGLDTTGKEKLTLSESGKKALTFKEGGEEVQRILKWIACHSKPTTHNIRKSLRNKFKIRALVKAKQYGWVKASLKLKPSNVAFKTLRIARAMKINIPLEKVRHLLLRSPKQSRVYELLRHSNQSTTDLEKLEPSHSPALRALCNKGLAEIKEIQIERTAMPPKEHAPLEKPLPFTLEQKNAYEELSRSLNEKSFSVHLLHGVTGCGKTEIYIRCIEKTIRLGRQAIVMVPEISLTPQTVDLFRRRFGDRVAILHSGLSKVDRYLEWKKILDDQVSIAVGARSAVFAPFTRLGLIIIDEEHDSSYKQDCSPRYHARDTAIVRAREAGLTVVLGSATPSLESRRNAEIGKYSYLEIKKRVPNRLLPLVTILDMLKERSERKNFSMLSIRLKNAIYDCLSRKEQAFLFLNRRGMANYLFCRECGYIFFCARCSVSLTYHKNENRLRCHYCNFTQHPPRFCMNCSGSIIKLQGFGTQKLEEEVHRLYPQAKIARLDRDTTRKHADFETAFRKIRAGEIDILIGTQMITKGHDFPNVTLVGVVSADISLNIPDFRSAERTFQLLTQVAGRAGRGEVPGQVIIQTSIPDHYVHKWTHRHDYEGFYKKELQVRRKLNYPPFTRLASLEIECVEEKIGRKWTWELEKVLSLSLSTRKDVEIIGPAPAMLYRLNERFRWRLILRSKATASLRALLNSNSELESFRKSMPRTVKLTLDIDPINLL